MSSAGLEMGGEGINNTPHGIQYQYEWSMEPRLIIPIQFPRFFFQM